MKEKLLYSFVLFISVLDFNSAIAQLLLKNTGQTIGSNCYSVCSGDLNNDGFEDIYISTGNTGGPGKIWLNDGTGMFVAGQAIGPTGITQTGCFADLNGNGFLDFFLTNDANYSSNDHQEGYPNEIWINDGTGHFMDSGQKLGNEPTFGVALGDVDGNGTIDAVVANYHTASQDSRIYKPNEVWFNDGNGKFTKSDQQLGTGIGGVSLVDIDGDNDLDAIFEGAGFWINDGTGHFTEGSKPFSCSTMMDMDNDGDPDAFIINRGSPNEVWLNEGDGNFINSEQKLGNAITTYAQFIDVEDDGDVDVFCSNYNSPGVLWINQGGSQGGKIATFLKSETEYPSGRAEICDLNNDGYLDAIFNNTIWHNTQSNTSSQQKKFGMKQPPAFELYPNYPNPFNSSTTIQYELSYPSFIKLTVFDLLGQEIQILQNGFQNAGDYSLTWDATDHKNTLVSSGIYFYSLQTNNRTLKKKMILIQ